MMLLERWAVGAILALTVPLVSTASGVFAPQQTQNKKTAHPVRNQDPDEQQGPDALPSKTIDEQDAPYIKAAEEQDAQSPKTGEDQNAPPEKTTEDQVAPPAKADDQPAPPVKAADDQDAQPAKAADDQDVTPVKTAQDQEAQPAKAAAPDPPVQPAMPNPIQNPQPAEAAVPVLASSPATPEQIKQQKFDKDTADLLRLVQELKAEVEKAGSNTLSVAALRKADEIQRLVKSLKEKMKEEGQGLVNKP
jgi:hypothetical protein